MGASDNRELARRVFEDFGTKRQRHLAEELLTADFVYHDPQVPNVHGPQGMADALAVFQNGLDGVWNIEEIVVGENDRVTVRWTGTGTHNHELMGIPPTGKPVRVASLALLRIDGNKIAEMWNVWDTLGMLQQLGVAPLSKQTAYQRGGSHGRPGSWDGHCAPTSAPTNPFRHASTRHHLRTPRRSSRWRNICSATNRASSTFIPR
ncbi:MAG: ester cyclase [Thermomicrobiales bacterium]